MKDRPIVFCGRREAEWFCRAHAVPSVVSFSDPRSPRPNVEGQDATIRFRFWDVDETLPGYPGPNPQAVEKLVTFLRESPYPMLIHCEAGISRSSAATMIGYYLLCGDERQAARHMIAARDGPMREHVRPNRLILLYADALLGSDLGIAAP